MNQLVQRRTNGISNSFKNTSDLNIYKTQCVTYSARNGNNK